MDFCTFKKTKKHYNWRLKKKKKYKSFEIFFVGITIAYKDVCIGYQKL